MFPLEVPREQPPRQPKVGRPSKAEPFRQLVIDTLNSDPGVRSKNILATARAVGYLGEKSALYALIGTVREEHRIARPKAPTQPQSELEERRRMRDEKRDAKRARQESFDAAERERGRGEAADRHRAELVGRVPTRLELEAAERQARRERKARERTADLADPKRLRAYARTWLESRQNTHKSIADDWSRWRRHLAPAFGDLLPMEVDVPRIRSFVEAKLAAGMNRTTIGHCRGLLSSLFTHLVEEGVVSRNPVEHLPKKVRDLCRSQHDPQDTPFIEDKRAIERLRDELTEPLRTMYALAVSCGLRTGELIALRWDDVRNGMRSLHVQRRFRQGALDTPKSGRGRVLPLSPSATVLLQNWRAGHPDGRLVFEPVFRATSKGHIHIYELLKREGWYSALGRVGLPAMTFYQACRHTFASQLVMNGVPLERVSKLLGHANFGVTMRYAHLRPENFNVPDVISFGVQQRMSDPMVSPEEP